MSLWKFSLYRRVHFFWCYRLRWPTISLQRCQWGIGLTVFHFGERVSLYGWSWKKPHIVWQPNYL